MERERAPSLRTYLWLLGSLFILTACLSFLAYLRFQWPWAVMVAILGGIVGLEVAVLEQVLVRPLERLIRMPSRLRDGVPLPPPGGSWVASEATRMWRALRALQDAQAQTKHAQRALEDRLGGLLASSRILARASAALRPEVPLEAVAPAVLAELAATLGVGDVYLVPLRRHCPVPVIGANGTPAWAEEVRKTGLAAWEPLLVDERPLALCLTSQAPAWRAAFGQRTLWIVPLIYHGRPQGVLLAAVGGAERAWVPEELELFDALAPILAAALHPPRWSEERKGPGERPEAPGEAWPEAPVARVKRNRRKGA